MSLLYCRKTTMMSSATVFIALAAVASVLTDCDAYLSEIAMKKTQDMLKNVCSKKYQVEEDTFLNVRNGIFPDDDINLKCYFSCILKMMQLISPKGVVEKKPFLDKIKLLAPPSVIEILVPAIEKCGGTDKNDVCQNSYDFIKCLYDADPRSLDKLPI